MDNLRPEIIGMDFSDLERKVFVNAMQAGKSIMIDSINENLIGELKQKYRMTFLDELAEPDQTCGEEVSEEGMVEAWGDSPWEKRWPKDRSGNRTPRLQAKIKGRKKAKLAKAARKYNR